jgi:hypothetical protein
LAKCRGPAYGYKPTSYRAEGYGLLSAIRFIHLSRKKWEWTSTYTIICDNKAIVKILQDSMKQEDTYPNLAISAEWDILSEIRATMDHNKMRDLITFQHIKGHADKDQPYNKLSLMQQLNVDVDRMADEYIQQNQEEDYTVVPLLPTSGIQLNMEGGTVTYRLKKTVMQARSQHIHREYLCGKNDWTPSDFQQIDWESHRRALNKFPARRTILVKYLNDITPVGKLVNRYDPKYPPNCPSCPAEQETQDHMLTCPCIERQQWRDRLLNAIQEAMDEYKTPEHVTQLFMEGIRYSIGHQATMSQPLSPTVSDIESAQTAIGWKQLMKGRMATAWRQAQHEAMQGKETKYRNAHTWSTTIIHIILDKWLELWTIRNKARFGRDWQAQQTAAKDQAVREIEHLYAYKGKIMPHQEWIFSTTLDQQKQKSTYILRAFISTYKQMILDSYQTRLETG